MTEAPPPTGAPGRAPGRSQAGPDPLGGSADVPVGRGAEISPCIGICRMDERTGWCEGCVRTIDEIIAWGRASHDEKRRIWALLPARRAAFDAMKDGTRP
jgi:uncharacterized protein